MRRRLVGLSRASQPAEVPDSLYLVRVERAEYRYGGQKPFYTLRFRVIEPAQLTGRIFTARLYSTAKAMWKLSWFLRDFSYDSDLFGRDELDEKRLAGLTGVVKLSHTVVNGTSLLNLEAFAPAAQWPELSGELPQNPGTEVA